MTTWKIPTGGDGATMDRRDDDDDRAIARNDGVDRTMTVVGTTADDVGADDEVEASRGIATDDGDGTETDADGDADGTILATVSDCRRRRERKNWRGSDKSARRNGRSGRWRNSIGTRGRCSSPI